MGKLIYSGEKYKQSALSLAAKTDKASSDNMETDEKFFGPA